MENPGKEALQEKKYRSVADETTAARHKRIGTIQTTEVIC